MEYEESDFFSDKKLYRKERRLARKLDRSKFKKTDREKQKEIKSRICGPLTGGNVVRIHGEVIFVDTGEIRSCSLPGTFKQELKRKKNLIVVGDRVQIDERGAIVSIEERKSVLSRADHLDAQREHLLASNIDKVFIFVSVVDPPLRTPIIDRYLIAAEKGNILPIIICNKVDLLEDEKYSDIDRNYDKEILDECKKLYPAIGIPFLVTSATTGEGLETVKKELEGSISVFSGQSGTGKSSILNAIAGFGLKVGKTVESSRKGSHTTSYAELLILPFGGYVVDTPGVKSFGIWEVALKELPNYFPEIAALSGRCKFLDCLHRGEEGCVIEEAIKNGEISPLRYASYTNIFLSIEKEHQRR
jgi:ribosome biogenesis GTPase / thiamine phosphate phosphatase